MSGSKVRVVGKEGKDNCISNLLDGVGMDVVDSYMYRVVSRLSSLGYGGLDEMIIYLKSLGYRVGEREVESTGESGEKRVVGKSKCILPFCGSKIIGRCGGIKLNYGLYSQCMNEISDKDVYCKTCSKQGVKSGTGKPTYGDISERISLGKEWRDKNGKEVVRYANVMDKLEISREQAEREATRFGLKIPEIEFEMKEIKRGRPKKSVEVSDTESEISVEPKKRGRPRKDKQVISSLSPGDDLIAGLIKSAAGEVAGSGHMSTFLNEASAHVINNAEQEMVVPEDLTNRAAAFMADVPKPKPKTEAAVSPPPSEEEEDEEEVEVEVEKFTHPKTGIEYYKTEDNILYSMDSEPVGRWNEESQEIEQVLDLDEDED